MVPVCGALQITSKALATLVSGTKSQEDEGKDGQAGSGMCKRQQEMEKFVHTVLSSGEDVNITKISYPKLAILTIDIS